MLLLPQCCAWPRSCPSVLARGVDHRRSATMSNASLFCGTLEPTRMRWECGQVRVTRLRKGSNSAGVQRCQVCAPINRENRERDRVTPSHLEYQFCINHGLLDQRRPKHLAFWTACASTKGPPCCCVAGQQVINQHVHPDVVLGLTSPQSDQHRQILSNTTNRKA